VVTDDDLRRFVADGFLRIDGAFPRDAADAARAILCRDLACDPCDPATWTRPVVRLGPYADEPFRRIVASEALREACDALAGAGRWLPLRALASLVVRFPHADDPGDTGWHVDASSSDATSWLGQWPASTTRAQPPAISSSAAAIPAARARRPLLLRPTSSTAPNSAP